MFVSSSVPVRVSGVMSEDASPARDIHVAHIVIDGMVDAPDTLGRMLGEDAFQRLRQERGLEHDGLLLPAMIADTYFHLSRQHRSAWTHELDLRPFSDTPWWNR